MDLNKIVSDVMNNILTLELEDLKKSLTYDIYRDKVNKKAIEILNKIFQEETENFKNEEMLEIIISFVDKKNNSKHLSRMYCTKNIISYERNYKENGKDWITDKNFIGVYAQLSKENESESGIKGIKFYFTKED